ncbi:hypothetical protein [Dictyobacter aurantiacus]|uniref:Uncharacterized protein n=1 Tax=Dictyobacter aurantiacus TaxID=1936993 RepID=A0A401ZCS4_9CHLR|nr:hypothetical protein [Dictyobacter aurantiacus]GCE04655.1 hypothetical protein KDAU_19840 [Dictyobacter aurantiacus]
MSEQHGQKDKDKQPDEAEIYGAQGNEGQYGQGQYDSEGKPDPHGPQGQQIKPDDRARKDNLPKTSGAKTGAQEQFTNYEVPQD